LPAVASEVEQNTESHDVETLQSLAQGQLHTCVRHTLVGFKVSVLGSNVLKLASGRVDNLHIASEVLVAIDFGEVAESLVGDLGDIEFMVTNSQQVVVDVLENGVGYNAVRGSRVTETGAIV
jgi:hypothetical protein